MKTVSVNDKLIHGKTFLKCYFLNFKIIDCFGNLGPKVQNLILVQPQINLKIILLKLRWELKQICECSVFIYTMKCLTHKLKT